MLKKIVASGLVALALGVPALALAQSVNTADLNSVVNACLSPAAGTDAATTQAACATLIRTLIALILQLTPPQTNGTPSCTISTDKSSYSVGDTVNLSWASNNATYANWVPDSSGKDNFFLGADKLSASGSATLIANITGNPFVTLKVTNASGQTALCSKIIPVASTAQPSTDSLSVSLDSSSLGYRLEAAGTTQVMLGVFKFHASGEAMTLNKVSIAMDDSAATPADLIKEYVYDGNTLVGTAIPLASSHAAQRYYAVSILSAAPVSIPANGDKVLTVRGDIANIGVGQPAHQGDLISIAIDGASATGQNSGMTVAGTFGSQYAATTQFSAGTRIFKTYPVINLIPLSSTGLVNGSNPVLRFSVTASPAGTVGLYKFAVNLSGAQASLTLPTLGVYTDAGYSQPVSGFSANSYSTVYMSSSLSNGVFAGGPVTLFLGPTGQALQIPAGQTYYFEVRDVVTLNGANAAVSTALNTDGTYQPLINANGTNVLNSNFFWSPNDISTTQFADADWTNGYQLPGFSAGAISQMRMGSGTVASAPSCTVSINPTSLTLGQNAVVTWSSQNATSISLTLPSEKGSSPTVIGGMPASGTQTVTPNLIGTLPYTLNVSGAGGSATCSATLTVAATVPTTCPVFQQPLCTNGTLVGQGTDTNGCQKAPLCVPNSSSLAVTNPATGNSYSIGNTMVINWSDTDSQASTRAYYILLWGYDATKCSSGTCSSGLGWPIAGSGYYLPDAHNGTYTWTVGTNIPPGKYIVRVCELGVPVCGESGPVTVSAQVSPPPPPVTLTPQKVFLTSGSTWTVPSGVTTLTSVECLGAGGGGLRGNAGGGGAYAKSVNIAVTSGSTINIGVGAGGVGGDAYTPGKSSSSPGGDTWFNATSLANAVSKGASVSCGAQGGAAGSDYSAYVGGAGGSTVVGTLTHVGGSGAGTQSGTPFNGGGGGGAGGPNGNGVNASSYLGAAGDGGSGGAGGASYGANGGNGAEWGSYGSGGGGASAQGQYHPPANSGNGGLYGGGGAGGAQSMGAYPDGLGGAGGNGLIVINYTQSSVATSANTAQLASALTALQAVLQQIVAALANH